MSKLEVGATWNDVPHLSPEQNAELWASAVGHGVLQQEARRALFYNPPMSRAAASEAFVR